MIIANISLVTGKEITQTSVSSCAYERSLGGCEDAKFFESKDFECAVHQ